MEEHLQLFPAHAHLEYEDQKIQSDDHIDQKGPVLGRDVVLEGDH
jgi:hypothetical protein